MSTDTASTVATVRATRPRTRRRPDDAARELAQRLRTLTVRYSTVHYELVCASAELADSDLWAADGFSSPGQWLADAADVEACTAREWIRIGRLMGELPEIADAFGRGQLSYSKVRTLTRVATIDNQSELVDLADGVPAGQLTTVLARWMHDTWEPEALDEYQQRRRWLRWRTDADGMTTVTLRLPPHIAAILISVLTQLVMRTSRPPRGEWPSVGQQYADAFTELLTDRVGTIDTEVVVHVRSDGCTTDDGTPLTDTVVASLIPQSFIRALIHDIDGTPIDATNRRRHPTTRQKRVVKERDRGCVDCGRTDLLHYDHTPPFARTGHTVTAELEGRCAPCHHHRHGS